MNFNSKITVSNTGGNLSNDSELILVKKFVDFHHFSDLSQQSQEIRVKENNHVYDYFASLEQLVYQNVAGYSTDSIEN